MSRSPSACNRKGSRSPAGPLPSIARICASHLLTSAAYGPENIEPMKVTYKGLPHSLPVKVQQKLDGKFAKLAKLLDGRGEREAHVIVTQERHRCCSEITVQFHDHKLVGKGADADLFTSM